MMQHLMSLHEGFINTTKQRVLIQSEDKIRKDCEIKESTLVFERIFIALK